VVTKKISLKIWDDNYVTLHTEKGEVDSRYIEVAFKDEHLNNLDLTGKSVTFFAQKPDKTQIFNICTVNTTTNTATIELTSEALDMAGVLVCEFQIFDSNNVLLKVGGLKIIVASEVDFNEAAESSSSADVITVIINSIGNLSSLTTSAKSNLVSAINELDAKVIPISQGGTGGTTAVEARTNLELMKGYSLYSNSSGTNGTITLSNSYTNYIFIGIIFADNGVFNRTVFKTDLGSLACLSNWYLSGSDYLTATGMYYHGAVISFSDTTATLNRNAVYNVKDSGDNTHNWDGIKVYSIIGYKY